MTKENVLATGRRKEAVARIRLFPGGNGNITVNGRDVAQYFPRETLQMICRQPLVLTSLLAKFDVIASVRGGGTTGQAGAVRHGIARALAAYDAELKNPLRVEGLITRDSRMKERKKYGQRGARARFQFSKR